MNKKGFTLIELLAVIVILAVIALIATPMVLDTIDDAKKGAASSSAYTYISEIETTLAKYMLKNGGTSYSSGKHTVAELQTDLGVKVKGDSPSEGSICIGSNGTVTKASIKINGYVVSYDGKNATTTDLDEVEDITCDVTVTYQEYYTGTKDVVSTIYYNPVTNAKCTEVDYNNNADKLGSTGCMKWYVIENSSSTKSTVDAILDHNTTAKVKWNSSENNADGMNEVQTELNNLVTVSEWKVIPRLIRVDELASITGAKDALAWNSSKNYVDIPDLSTTISYFYFDGASGSDATWKTQIATSQGTSNYAWLFDYTDGCTSYGCNIDNSSTNGYWTSTPVTGYTDTAWAVRRNGRLDVHRVYLDTSYGCRPVITIDKQVLK